MQALTAKQKLQHKKTLSKQEFELCIQTVCRNKLKAEGTVLLEAIEDELRTKRTFVREQNNQVKSLRERIRYLRAHKLIL